MVCIFVGAVATVRTGFRSAVLNSIVVRPASIGKAVALLGGGTNVAFTSGAVGACCVLRRAVLAVRRGSGMVAVGIGTFAAVVASFGTTMLRSGVILPITVAISAVGCTVVDQLIAVVTIFGPIASRPCSAGRIVFANRIIF